MKQTILLLIIALLAIAVQAQEGPPPTSGGGVKIVYRCPKVCDCPTIYKPVCGKSGLTHGNACLAACFKDKIANLGSCKKCKSPKKVTKSACSYKNFGKSGKRRRCCTWIQSGLVKLNKRCRWVGKTSYRKEVTTCKWKKRSKGVKQKYCCTYVKHTTGKLSRCGKKRCKWVGVKVTKVYKNHCRMRACGQHSRRKYCCKESNVCHGKKCRKTKRCAYTGAYYSTYLFTKCSWTRRNKSCKQRKCCDYKKTCVRTGGKSSCKKKKLKCRWIGHKITSKKFTKCNTRPYGNKATRTRCCSWKRVCVKKDCNNKLVKCWWKGCAVRVSVKNTCKWKKRGKNTTQRQCCTRYRKCACSKCSTYRTTCKFVGFKITKTKNHCHWKPVGNNGRVRVCCDHTKKCFKGKCQIKKKCKNVSRVHTRKIVSKCTWVFVRDGVKRRKCCKSEKRCCGKKCSVKKIGCRFTNVIVFIKNARNCTWKKHGKHCKRKYCCTVREQCVKQNGKKTCVKKVAGCKYIGKLIRNEKKKLCRTKVYGKHSTRTRCCTWTKYCVGKKCQPINKTCNWTGLIKTVRRKVVCKWALRKKGCKQRHCCTTVKTCHRANKGKEKCKTTKGRCSYVGHKIYFTSKRKCKSIALPNNCRRVRCCEHATTCQKGKCKTNMRNCSYRGPIYRTTVKRSCSFIVRGGYKQEKCCDKTTTCVGKKCRLTRNVCKWTNRKIKIYQKKTSCRWVQLNKQFRRLYCCHVQKVCNHKGKCSMKTSNCSYKGKKVGCRRKFNKIQRKCVVKGRKTTCCNNYYSCVQFGSGKASCKFVKKYSCKTIIKRVVTGPSRPGYCYSTGDPHYKSFDGKKFNHYVTGDWVLLKSRKFTVHARTKKWNRASVNTQFVANCNGDIVKSFGKTNSFLVNGRKVTLKKGETKKLRRGGRIVQKENNRAYIYSSNGAYLDVRTYIVSKRPQPYYINIIARVPNVKEVTGGLCVGEKKTAKGLFNHKTTTGKETGAPKCTGRKRALAKKQCQKAGCSNSGLEDCIADVCENFSAKDDKQAEDDEKEDRKPRQCKNVPLKYDRAVKFLTATELRARTLKRCKHNDKFCFYSCVYDTALGFPRAKEEYQKVADFYRNIAKGTRKCYSTGDPHIKTFTGKGFNVYNVEQKKRVLYQHADLKVACDVQYNKKKWGTRGINSAVYITQGSKSFSVQIPQAGKFRKCGEKGFKVSKNHSSQLERYGIVAGKTVIQVTVNRRGYIDVYITAEAKDTHNCTGDCCANPQSHKSKHGNITFKYGDPYKVKFTSACERKEKAIKLCTKKTKDFDKVCDCLEDIDDGEN